MIRVEASQQINHPERSSHILSFPYRQRHLFGGSPEIVLNPYTRTTSRSGETTMLTFSEDAFSLDPQFTEPLQKLSKASGVTAPEKQSEILPFVQQSIKDVKDSEGNTHFENPVVALLFPPQGKEEAAVRFIESLTPPERGKADSCSEAKGVINGIEMDFHLHAGYQGNNKRVLTMFALMGHKPSQALLKKWVQNEPEFANKTSVEVALKMTDIIIERKAKERTAMKEKEQRVLTSDERASSIASAVFASALAEGVDPVITEAFKEIREKKFVGKLDITQEQPAALRELNEEYTEAFTNALKAYREERDVPKEALVKSLVEALDVTIEPADLEKPLSYPPKTNKEAAIILAHAMEIATRPGGPQPLQPKEQQAKEYSQRLKQEKGIMYFQLGMTHDTPYHVEGVSAEGKALLCTEHAHESDATLQQQHEAIVDSVKNLISGKTIGSQQRRAIKEFSRSNVLKTKLKPAEGQAPDLLSNPTVQLLKALGSKDVEKNQEKAKLAQGFTQVAEVVDAAVRNPDNVKIKRNIAQLIAKQPVGEIRIEEQKKMTEDFPQELASFSRDNQTYTKTFVNKLKKQQEKDPTSVTALAEVLAQLHDKSITAITLPETLPKFDRITKKQAIMILALDVALQAQPESATQLPQSEKIQELARVLNNNGFFYINLIPFAGHAGAFHFEGALKKGILPVLCAEHTPQSLNEIKEINTIVQQEAKQNQSQRFRTQPIQPTKPPMMQIARAIPYAVPYVPSGYVVERVHSEISRLPSAPLPRPRQEASRPPTKREAPKSKRSVRKDLSVEKKRVPPAFVPEKPKEPLYRIIKKQGAPRAPIGLRTTEDPSKASGTIAVEAPAPSRPEVSIAVGARTISRAQLAESSVASGGSRVSVSSEKPSVQRFHRLESAVSSPNHVDTSPLNVLKKRVGKVAAIQSSPEKVPAPLLIKKGPEARPTPPKTNQTPAVETVRSIVSASDGAQLASVRAALQELTDNAAPKSAQLERKAFATKLTLVHATASNLNIVESVAPSAEVIPITRASSVIKAQPLKLVKTEKGIAPEDIPANATAKAHDTAPIINYSPKEIPDEVAYVASPEAGESAPSSSKVHTYTPSTARRTIAVASTQSSVSESRPTTPSVPSRTIPSTDTSPSAPKPKDTLNPHQTADKQAHTVKDVSVTTAQVKEAFEVRAQQQVDQQVASELKQAASTTTQEAKTEQQESQVAKGATKAEAEQIKQDSQDLQGTNGQKENTHQATESVHHQENTGSETEKVTKVKTASGETRFGVEKIATVESGANRRQTEGEEAADQTPSEQTASTGEAEAQLGRGTVESRQTQTTQQNQNVAPVIPLSSRRKVKRENNQQAAMTAQAGVRMQNGYLRTGSVFETREDLQEVLAGLAA